MLTKCPICSSLMSSHAYESHRYVHDSTDRSFMCERGCMDMFFETADKLEMHEKYLHVTAEEERTNLSHSNNTGIVTNPRTRPFKTCTICSRTICIGNMPNHMTLHSPTGRPFQCMLGCCRTYFTTDNYLKAHNLTVHNKKPMATCTVCGIVTNYMNRHMRTHGLPSEKRMTHCTVCRRSISVTHVKLHMKCHSPAGKPFSCADGCPKTYFATAKILLQHKRRYHRFAGETTCTVCGVEDVKPNLAQHMLTHDPTGRPFQCTDGCVKTFFKTRILHATHGRLKHNKFLYNHTTDPNALKTACTVCGKRCTNRQMTHHMVVHNSEGRPFKCDDGCKETYFTSQRNLREHRLIVHRNGALQNNEIAPVASELPSAVPTVLTKSQSQECTICKRNILGYNMKRHMACHSPTGKPFECARGCFQTYFKTKETLGHHTRRVHNIMAETTCRVCGVEDVKPNITQHMLFHDPTGRPFQCTDGCVKTFFTSRANLMHHSRVIHNNITRRSIEMTRSECSVCGMTRASDRMSRHMMVHKSDGRPFKCDKGCKETYFASKRSFREHNVKNHRADLVQPDLVASKRAASSTAEKSVVAATPSVLADVKPTVTPTTSVSAASVVRSASSSVKSTTVTSTAQRSIINTPTVQTMFKMESESPETTSVNNQKKCSVCHMVVKRSFKLHMTVHKPSDFPCTLGCVKTYSCSANALKMHISNYHTYRLEDHPTEVSKQSLLSPSRSRRRNPSSSSAASDSESSSDNSEDDDWSGSKNKKSKRILSQEHGPTAISTPLPRVSRKREICTVSPTVREGDLHEERVPVKKSVLT